VVGECSPCEGECPGPRRASRCAATGLDAPMPTSALGLPLRQVQSAKMAQRFVLTPSKARRLMSAALSVDETLAHVDRSLSDFDAVLVEFRSLLVDFAAVLERFGESVARVDGTVDQVAVITTELGEVVDEMGAVAQTFSRALALNDQFRRQLDRLRSLAGSGGSDTTPEQ